MVKRYVLYGLLIMLIQQLVKLALIMYTYDFSDIIKKAIAHLV